MLFGHRVLGALIVPDREALQEVASSSGAPAAWLVAAFFLGGGGCGFGKRGSGSTSQSNFDCPCAGLAWEGRAASSHQSRRWGT